MPRTVQFNRFPGIRPCPLYTPPVALTDGGGFELRGVLSHPWRGKSLREPTAKGKRSRNKASVGEPADGSLPRSFESIAQVRPLRIEQCSCIAVQRTSMDHRLGSPVVGSTVDNFFTISLRWGETSLMSCKLLRA